MLITEELTLNHVSGNMFFHLKGNEVQVRDTLTDQLGLAVFKDVADALRFVGEYLINTNLILFISSLAGDL